MISKINTCGFKSTLFQPLPSVYENNMTYVEFCLNLAKSVNELIVEVERLAGSVDGYDERIKNVEDLVTEINSEIADINTALNSKASLEQLESGLNNLKYELQLVIAENFTTLKEYSDSEDAKLQYQIDNFAVENIKLYDPTTGLLSPLQTVIDNLFDSTRDEAITASEYDGLELSAEDYDALQITAIEYDRFGKTILAS